MTLYTVEIKRGERVIHCEQEKQFSNQEDAWKYVVDLAADFYISGIRVVVKDEEGGILLMAGLNALQHMNETAA